MKELRKLDTSHRVLKVLTLLHKKPRSLDELCYELDTTGQGVNRETISKYFATLRFFGCEISKRGGKFRLMHVPFVLNLDEFELEALAVFEKFGKKLCPESRMKEIKSAVSKILKMENAQSLEKYAKKLEGIRIKDIYAKYTDKMEQISRFFDAGAIILYKGSRVRVSPKYFKYSKCRVYLYAFNEEKRVNELFLLDNIKEISHLAKSSNGDFLTGSTTFKIKDRLARGYHLYEGEHVLEEGSDYKIISNKLQDKTELMRRCLKYGELCEILTPKEERQQFVQRLDAIIANFS